MIMIDDTENELRQRIAELEQENDRLTEANHSVSVCAEHTRDITIPGKCVICELYDLHTKLRSIVEEAQAFKETNILYNIEITQAEIKDFIVKLASLTLPGEENNE